MKEKKSIHIAIVSSLFRREVSENLEKHCIATLTSAGVLRKNIHVFGVPGSLEIPLVARKLAQKEIYEAIITFGAILKGKTYHFEQIANECARGCMNVSWEFGIPVIFEVLAVYKLKDALDRATRQKENKGVEAAHTALSMIDLLSTI